ncbi:hypothetical protein roselon_03338 [Roseibacterium elongatum DSM 19469]|uniref:Uncharacterized protein n=1 Tax=Roseicyclus elongatus DSM 19469 TaxID=1294273 RepID=W8S9D0_9RHOB|nr:hypothetical protein roselon_03338 [Roseibacterium elongatum DSM 19469]
MNHRAQVEHGAERWRARAALSSSLRCHRPSGPDRALC